VGCRLFGVGVYEFISRCIMDQQPPPFKV